MQIDSFVFCHALFTWYKYICNNTLKTRLLVVRFHLEIVIMFHAVSGSSHLFDKRPTLCKKNGRGGSQKHNITNQKNCTVIQEFTYLFLCSNCKNENRWSVRVQIIQIHSISEEVFPLMPAWKLPSSWQPEAEENGRELASPKANMATRTYSPTLSDKIM